MRKSSSERISLRARRRHCSCRSAFPPSVALPDADGDRQRQRHRPRSDLLRRSRGCGQPHAAELPAARPEGARALARVAESNDGRLAEAAARTTVYAVESGPPRRRCMFSARRSGRPAGRSDARHGGACVNSRHPHLGLRPLPKASRRVALAEWITDPAQSADPPRDR